MNAPPVNPIPIGSRVRWGSKYNRSDWVGVVTAHTSPKSVQCDGKGSIANGLLEVIEDGPPPAPAAPAPVDPMAELIAQQCELIAELQEAKTLAGKEKDELEEFRTEWAQAVALLEQFCSDTLGDSRPSKIENDSLRGLTELFFVGVRRW
jgi:hypothetical protein